MPFKTDKQALDSPLLRRNTKLLPCQKEMMHYWHQRGMAIRAIARLFHCDRRTVTFVLFPERHEQNLQRRAERGGSKIYYNREKHTAAIREHRRYKHNTLTV